MKNLIYKLLDPFYPNGRFRTISGVRLRLPFRYARYYPVDYELEHIDFFRKHIQSGDVILDIGAQMGLMSKVFADLTGPNGKVFAFEPAPPTFRVLCETIRMNHLQNTVKPVQKAVSDKKGKTTFYISDVPLDPANSLVDYERQHRTGGIDVDLISIDDFVTDETLQKLNFIKIDAEGAEYGVLKGAGATLDRFRPLVHLALHPMALSSFNSSLALIYTFVTERNYTIVYKGKPIIESEFVSKNGLFDVELIPNENKHGN